MLNRVNCALQGWINERVAHHVSSAGDRVVYVLPGDSTSHLHKVQEVVKVMEQEMGLSPGWLWHKQRCKVGMHKHMITCSIISTSFSLSLVLYNGIYFTILCA